MVYVLPPGTHEGNRQGVFLVYRGTERVLRIETHRTPYEEYKFSPTLLFSKAGANLQYMLERLTGARVGWNSFRIAGRMSEVTMGHKLSMAHPKPMTMKS
jgi:hypothetical protein